MGSLSKFLPKQLLSGVHGGRSILPSDFRVHRVSLTCTFIFTHSKLNAFVLARPSHCLDGRIKYYLKDKDAFDLGGAKTKRLINWIFWWEAGLAVFSILGAYYVVPPVVFTPVMEGKGWIEVMCGPSSQVLDDRRAGFWICLFCVSSGKGIIGTGRIFYLIHRSYNCKGIHFTTIIYGSPNDYTHTHP